MRYNSKNDKNMGGKMKVTVYVKENDNCPFDDFMKEQNKKNRADIYKMLERLEKYGQYLREPYSKSLKDGIFELRIKNEIGIIRVLYFFIMVILL